MATVNTLIIIDIINKQRYELFFFGQYLSTLCRGNNHIITEI